jgi:acetyl-CoA acetyltransferase
MTEGAPVELSGVAAIAGLGMSEVGRVYGGDATDFAGNAVLRAVEDAGLSLSDVDGLLTSWGASGPGSSLQHALGLRDLRLNVQLTAYGASAGAAVQYAAMAVASGMATTIVYVHGDAPLADPGVSATDVYGAGRARRALPAGLRSVVLASGISGANHTYAMAARRHMAAYGTTEDDFAAVAVAQRAWAAKSPLATMRTPITIEDHHASRWIAEPLRLLDCCLVSNGAVAVVVTSAARARHLAQRPVYIWGWGQGHPGYPMASGSQFGLVSGAAVSGPIALGMAGLSIDAIDVAELYDCYTYTVLISLEDYGFCGKGEAGAFVASGATGPAGELPTNTGGGQLSGYYLWGATPLSEGVMQARGQAGERQADRHDFVLVSGNGGTLDYHATLVLGAHPR